MRLILDGEVIWENPPGIGHFAIKLRKQILEEEIAERMMRRHHEQRRLIKLDNVPLPPYLGTEAETPAEIVRSLNRRYPIHPMEA